MKAYVITTGIIFALIAAAHIWRIIAETPALLGSATFLLLTAAAAGLAIWAWLLVGRKR
jgi:hypothetical protein